MNITVAPFFTVEADLPSLSPVDKLVFPKLVFPTFAFPLGVEANLNLKQIKGKL